MTTETPAISQAPTAAASDRKIGLVVGVICVLASVGFVFYHFFGNQIRHAITNPADWGHTLIIPFMAGYLAWLNRHKIEAVGFKVCWWGLVPIVLGMAWYIFCWLGPQGLRHHNLMAAGVGLSLFGIVLLFAGTAAMRYLWFPLLYMLAFGVTISDRLMSIVTYKLQDIAAKGAHIMLTMMGYTADLSGNTITLIKGAESYPLNVAEACSGMRMLVAFLALGVFLAYLRLNFAWQRIALVLLAVPVALFVNVLRVVTLGILSIVNPEFAAGDFHSFVGLVWLLPALFLYLGIIWILNKLVVADESAAKTKIETLSRSNNDNNQDERSFNRMAMKATVICCATLMVCGLGFQSAVKVLQVHLSKDPVPLRRKFDKMPRQLGEWERVGEDLVLGAASVEALGTLNYLSRVYVRDDDNGQKSAMRFHTAYYTDTIDAVPHVPERCFFGAGLVPQGGAEHIPVQLDTSKWVLDDGPVNARTEQPYHLLTAYDRWTRRPYTVRMPILKAPGEVTLRVWEFQDPANPNVRQVAGYFFIANGCATARAEDIRTLAFNRTDQYAYYAKVEFSTAGKADTVREEFLANATDLLNELLPEIMRSLPDWAEVERGEMDIVATSPEYDEITDQITEQE